MQPYKDISEEQFNGLSKYPANGTYIRNVKDGAVYRIINGGHMYYIKNWNDVGGVQPSVAVDLDAANLINSANLDFSPVGVVDTITGGEGSVSIKGWAFDDDKAQSSLSIHVYIGGAAGSSNAIGYNIGKANTLRTDVNAVYPGVGNNHGYNTTITTTKRGTQEVYIYAINASGTAGGNTLIGKGTIVISEPATQPTAQPTALKLSVASASSMKITWAKATGVSGYEVWYATSENGTYKNTKTTSESNYTQTGLKAGTTYYYKIRSYKTVSGIKVYSAYTSVTSKKLTVPKPTNVKLANSDATSLKISWSEVADASGYEIHRATSETGKHSKIETITSGTIVSYTNKNLTNNKTYYYKIRAYKTVSGVKKYSSYCSILSKKVTLAKPTLTAAAKSKTSIKLSWAKVPGATKYEIYRSTSKNGTYKKIKTVTTVSYTNTKLTSDKTYYYKVKAVQDSYKSIYSAVKWAKTSK